VDGHLDNLRKIKSQQSYGFLMTLLVRQLHPRELIKILRLTETLLLRRHICRERTNENESLFARLSGIDLNEAVDAVSREYSLMMPSDEQFQTDFARFEFKAALMERARYCLEQIENRLQGNYSELAVTGTSNVHVEHIIPQRIKTKKAKDEFGDWLSYLGDGAETLHPRYVSKVGNLTLFAGSLNITASNNPYDAKKEVYKNSALRLTNQLPTNYPQFRLDEVDARSAELAKIAVVIWPSIATE
jgi:hypothetical protein